MTYDELNERLKANIRRNASSRYGDLDPQAALAYAAADALTDVVAEVLVRLGQPLDDAVIVIPASPQ